jgi:UDP-N-acetylmuramoyl-tripeptide--D-alanyl-D-alanine ligase
MLTLDFVLDSLSDSQLRGQHQAISSVTVDSRDAEPGSLFFAFQGEKADGHDFIGEAISNGAIAAVAERPIDEIDHCLDLRLPALSPEIETQPVSTPICLIVDDALESLQKLAQRWRDRFPDVRVIGITGSVGKTTTKELTDAVLSQSFRTLKSEGNYNNEIGLPLTLLQLSDRHEIVILEMGMYTSGEIALLCDLARPDVGVVTIVGSVHMEWLGSIEAIAAAKQELVEALPPAPEGVAILNKDDSLVMDMAEHTEARVVTYGLDSSSDLWADNIISMGLDGMRFTLHHGPNTMNVQVPLLGRHSVHTSLRAAAVGLVEGMKWEAIIAGLHSLTSQLRLVAVPGPRNSIILDDTYNSSPESAVAALNLLADINGRRIAVLGDMLELGPVEERSHKLVGRRVKDVAQFLITVGKLGRLIGEEALMFGMPEKSVYMLDNTSEAVDVLRRIIQPDDVVLVKGSHGARLDRIVDEIGLG